MRELLEEAELCMSIAKVFYYDNNDASLIKVIPLVLKSREILVECINNLEDISIRDNLLAKLDTISVLGKIEKCNTKSVNKDMRIINIVLYDTKYIVLFKDSNSKGKLKEYLTSVGIAEEKHEDAFIELLECIPLSRRKNYPIDDFQAVLKLAKRTFSKKVQRL